jgi:predicted site-specific integrase-resolvase
MELLKRKQVAQMFGVAMNTIRVWERQGLITPCCHINKRPRYYRNDLEKIANPKNENNAPSHHD